MQPFMDLIFGHGKDLTATQMCARSVIVFFICFLLIRISGRRSFAFKTPLDNVISIILGALISRVIIGASPFWPTVAASLCLVLTHRVLGILRHRYSNRKFMDTKPLLLYVSGHFVVTNLQKAMVTTDDILSILRKELHQETLNGIHKIYMEKTGQLSFVNISSVE